ncbi:MAG TPA: hypothetical protein VJ987_01975 [Anaerolineales bacterium]|nr:hypothetical protein [Anaerolineales bacterium]
MIDLSLTNNRWKELRDEIFEVQEWAREKTESHLRRRVFLRTIAANIEGCVNMLAYLLVSNPTRLSAAELSILNETQYELKNTGEPKEKERYYPCIPRWRLIVKIMERELGASHWEVDFADNDFNNFKMIFTVRNRIAHPKIDASLNIEDKEMDSCVKGYQWFIKNYQGICKV